MSKNLWDVALTRRLMHAIVIWVRKGIHGEACRRLLGQKVG
jgi:hypothetical protein